MELTPAILPPYERCTDTALPKDFIDPPSRFVDPQNEFRLIPPLREAAEMRNPYKILARSAAAFFRAQHPTSGSSPQEDVELGNALADLAVTGGMTYSLFKTPPLNALDDLAVTADLNYIDLHHPPLSEVELRDVIAGQLASLVQATPAEVASAISPALDRAYDVAWALRGPVAQRAAARPPGWIAVSGEDDMPHRPVNVPAPPFEQYEIPVTARGVTVQTRFFIASPPGGTLPAGSPRPLRVLPPDLQPHVPDGNNVILFLHGHSSGAEEALTIIPHIHMAGLKQGKKFSIISFDLPNNGYSESFNHEKVATSSATTWPAGLLDHGPVLTPVLDFIEDFIVAFVDALDQITPIKNRFSGVMGGSLGGNMGLRLGRRNPLPAWLDTGIVSWNAASVWQPMIQDLLKSQAPGQCQNNWNATETPDSRVDYFHEVYEKTVLPIIVPHTQPELWYRTGWEPCKRLHIEGSRIARREIYNENFRQWHWRVAGEQLIYSHVDRVDHEDKNSPIRYELNKVSHLLIGSQNDNFSGSNIFDATRTLSSLMVNTPGRSLFLRDTGHSVHFERPAFLAKQIVGFLPATPATPEMPAMPMSMQITCIYREEILSVGKKKRTGPPKLGRILLVGGINQTQNIPFSITVAECVFYIDHGCEFFVIRADGSRTAVQVVRKGGRKPYIATVHDSSEANNLLSLPKC
jgi:pimeloyl-ACP methyl ester carboxylesterase